MAPIDINQDYPGIHGAQILHRHLLEKADPAQVLELGRYICRDVCNIVERRTGTWIELLEVKNDSTLDEPRAWKELKQEVTEETIKTYQRSDSVQSAYKTSVSNDRESVHKGYRYPAVDNDQNGHKHSNAIERGIGQSGRQHTNDSKERGSDHSSYIHANDGNGRGSDQSSYKYSSDGRGHGRRGARGASDNYKGHSSDSYKGRSNGHRSNNGHKTERSTTRLVQCFTVDPEALNRLRQFLVAREFKESIAVDHEAVIRRLTEKPHNLDYIAFLGLRSTLMHGLQGSSDKTSDRQYSEWFVRIRSKLIHKTVVQHNSAQGHLRSVGKWLLMVVDVFGLGAMVLLPEMSWAVFESLCTKETLYQLKKEKPQFARACDDVERMMKGLSEGRAVGSEFDNDFAKNMKAMINGLDRENIKKQAERFEKIQKQVLKM